MHCEIIPVEDKLYALVNGMLPSCFSPRHPEGTQKSARRSEHVSNI
jgi:hypothetical protein